jgi:cytochrome c biogenesis protein
VQYKLRDKTGQAREFMNYMQPVTLEGAEVYLAGVRSNPSDPFSFLRIPADDKHGVREWMRLRAALADPACARKPRAAMPNAPCRRRRRRGLARQLQESAAKTLASSPARAAAAGRAATSRSRNSSKDSGGRAGKGGGVFMKMLNGAMWELWQAARARGRAAGRATEAHGRFLQLATNALSDSFFYGAPVYLSLEDFTKSRPRCCR